ncbi:cation transporting ATPase C-terminal domain-containing protein [Streptomyces sp. D2-8]|uniref:cation transporting ATPase C-terminal domain-containing protein n=1 Tax=Streptomyces sp. D2-8 TaxID=2707767 RepID=UPI0035B285A3
MERQVRLSSTRRLAAITRSGAVMAAGTLAVFAGAHHLTDTATAATMAFTTFVLFQLCNALAARSEDGPVLGRHQLHNRTLWICLAAVLTLPRVGCALPVGENVTVSDTRGRPDGPALEPRRADGPKPAGHGGPVTRKRRLACSRRCRDCAVRARLPPPRPATSGRGRRGAPYSRELSSPPWSRPADGAVRPPFEPIGPCPRKPLNDKVIADTRHRRWATCPVRSSWDWMARWRAGPQPIGPPARPPCEGWR